MLFIGAVALVFLFTYQQPDFPTTWFDEGLVLQGAINLVQHGQYAMRSAEGFRVVDPPLIANGPGIVLPITMVFAVTGIGLLQARLLMAAYSILATVLFNRVSRLMYGETAAFLSTLALLAVPNEGFILYGRQALGNVPALVYFLAGCFFFARLADRREKPFACLAGFFWGLTLVTKNQYWIILPVLIVVILLDLAYYKQIGFRSGFIVILFILGPVAIWQVVQFLLIGSANYGQHIEATRSSASVSVFALRAVRIPGNIWYLVRSGFLIFVIPGLVLAALDSIRRRPSSVARAFLVLFVVSWSFWYIFISVGWHRYALEAYAVGMIFCGAACVKAFEFIVAPGQGSAGFSWRTSPSKPVTVIFLILSSVWLISGGVGQIQRIMIPPEPDPQRFAEYLRTSIQPGTVVESWEWELDVLAPELTYHHPENVWMDRATAEIQFGEVYGDRYDPLAFNSSYLIDGPFSKWTGLYADLLSKGCCVKLIDIEDYTLYRVVNRVERQPDSSTEARPNQRPFTVVGSWKDMVVSQQSLPQSNGGASVRGQS